MNLLSSFIFIVLSNNFLVSEVNSQELARLNRTLLTRRNTRRTGTSGANGDNQIPRLDNRQGLPRDLHYLQPTRRRCNKNIRIPNGKRRLLDGGTVVRFRCEPGFLLFGSPSAACVRGQWSEPIPACIRWGCGRLAIPHGTVGRPLYGGAAIYFECNAGFQMTANSNLLVCDGLRWNGTVPACRGAIPTTTTMEASTTEFSTISTNEPDLDEGLMENWPDFTEDNKLLDDWITFAVETKRNMTSTPKPDWTVAIDLDKEDHDSRHETFTTSAISLETAQGVATNERYPSTQATSTASATLPTTTTSTTKLTLTAKTPPIPITTTIATTKIVPSTSSPTTSPTTSSDNTSTIADIRTTTRSARINNRAPYGWNIPAINVTSNTSRGEVHWINFTPTQRSSRRTTAGLNHLRCLLLSNAESTRRCLDALAHPTPRPVLRPWISGYPIRWYNMTLPTPPPVSASDSENERATVSASSATLATSSSSTTATAVSMKMTSTAPSTDTTRAKTQFTTTTRITTSSATTTSTTTRSATSARETRPSTTMTRTTTTTPSTTTKATTSTTTTTRRPRTSTAKKIAPRTTTTTTSSTTRRTTRKIPATAPPSPWFPVPSTAQPSERDKDGPEDSDNSISQFLPREKNELRGQSVNERREFIAPFKLDTDVPGIEPKATSHSAFTTVAVVLVLLCLGTGAAFVAYKLWRRNMGIARPSRHDSDRRNLSTSLDMEEEFVYFSNRS